MLFAKSKSHSLLVHASDKHHPFQVPEEALAHSFVTCGSVMATSYNAKTVAMAKRNGRKD